MQISISGLTMLYPGGIKALDGIDLNIENGMFGLLGPNGAGKTTLIRILATLLPPTAGEVTIGQFNLSRHPYEIRTRLGPDSQNRPATVHF